MARRSRSLRAVRHAVWPVIAPALAIGGLVAASVRLPGSNLPNLLVLARGRVPGATFVVRMWPAWVAAVVITALVVAVAHRNELSPSVVGESDAPFSASRPGLLGVAGTGMVIV